MTLAKAHLRVSEKAVQKEIVDYLRLNHWLVFEYAKRGTAGFCPHCKKPFGLRGSIAKGHPDILAFKHAADKVNPLTRILAIECKRPGEKPDETQLAVHEELRAAGARVLVARGISDLQERSGS